MNLKKGLSSIYGRAVILIGASLTLVTILLTYATVRQQSAALTHDLRSRVATLAEQQAVSVSDALWNLNREAVEVVLRGVARDPDFLAATVHDEKSRVFAHVGAPDLSAHRIESRRASIYFEDNGDRKTIGTLSLAFSMQRLEREQRELLKLALLLGLLQLAAVLAATAFALRAVTGPLQTITERMIAIARGENLNMAVPHKERQDQIGDIARAVGTFRTESLKRQQAEEELRLANVSLDRRVQERTRELTDRDARLQGIMDNVSDGIVTIDENGTVETANRSAGRIFGYMEADLIGRNVNMLMPEPDHGRHDDYIANYIRTGQGKIIGVGPREVTGRHNDGKEIQLELAVSEMRIGDARKFIGLFREIGERKESERRLRQAQKMETVGHLTGGIAHDFNNFLTVILGNLDLLDREVPDARVSKRTKPALAAAARGAELTKRLLAFSRRQTLVPQVVDMNDVIRGMDDMLRRTLNESIDIRLGLADGLWRTEIDAHELENAVLNLAVNARDAMADGGCLTITTANARLDDAYVATHDYVAAGEYVVVAVSDTGTGMSPEVKERALEPFFTTKEHGKGTGLGLSMIYGFVKQSRGHLEIYSEQGYGTTLKLYFPRVHAAKSPAAGTAAKEGIRKGTETILIVEDNPDVRDIAVTLLGGQGYRVLSADGGAAALAALEAHPEIDLLFTDVVMPGGMTGVALAREAKARNPALKVLFTSGYPKDAMGHSGQLDKGAEMIGKPYDLPVLARKVRQVLDG